MKKTYIIITAVFAAMTISCEKSVNEIIPEEQSEEYVKTFTCVFAAPESVDSETKVALASDGKTTWEVGDKIMLHGGTDGAGRKLVTLTAGDISVDGKKATFTVDGLAPYDRSDAGVVSTYYAQYPGDMVPEGNMYYECAFNNTNGLLMAACNEGDTFNFFNLCGVISFVVDDDFDSVIFSGNNGENVTFTDYYQVRVRDDGSGAYCNYHKPGNGFKTNTPGTTISTSVVSDGSTVNYIYLPKGVSFSGGFLFKFMKSGDIVKTAKVTSAIDINHGKLLPLGDITSKLKPYVAPSSHDSSIDMTSAIDLSSSASANCYLLDSNVSVAADQVYTFKAYKGNSSVGVGTIASTCVLWETYNNNTSVDDNSVIAEVDYDKQPSDDFYTIVFKMPNPLHAGNAVIAAKNSGGNILWSWHIWVPSTDVSSADYGIHTSGKVVMDRNLGALVVATASPSEDIPIESVGLFYQWGRKDPFVGPSVIDEGKYPAAAKVAGEERTADKVQITLAQSIENPTFFARGLYGPDKDDPAKEAQQNPDWCSSSSADYWGGDEGAKTIYDPCPAGFRVPRRDSDKALWASDITTQTGWSYNADHYWFTLGSPATVFPAVGWIDGGSMKTSFRVGIWNTHSDSWTNGYGYNHYAGYARRLYIDGGLQQRNSSVNKSLGYSVRCVAE